MRTDRNAPGSCRFDGPQCAIEIMSPVYLLQCLIIARFDPVLDRHIVPLRQLSEIIQLPPVNAIGTGADNNPCHFGQFKGFRKNSFQPIKRCIGIGKRLEIGKITISLPVTVPVKFNTLLQLLPDTFARPALGRGKGFITAKSTAAVTERSVPIGTAKAGIDRQFLDTRAERTAEITRIAVVTPLVTPRIHDQLLCRASIKPGNWVHKCSVCNHSSRA